MLEGDSVQPFLCGLRICTDINTREHVLPAALSTSKNTTETGCLNGILPSWCARALRFENMGMLLRGGGLEQ